MKNVVRSVIGLAVGLVVGLLPTTVTAQGHREPQPGSKGWVSPEPLPPDTALVACFAEGTDPAYAEAVNTLVAMRNQAFFGPDFYAGARWSGALGTPRALTWSFVPDGLSIPGGVGEATAPSNLFATMDAAFASQGGRATWILRFQQIFDRWHALTGLSYTRITSGANDWDDGAAWGSGGAATRGDIRISMHVIDGASGILAYCQFPSNGDMVLDSGDSGNFASSANLNRFLRNTVAHEHGHGIGLQHMCSLNSNQLMEPFLSTAFDGPQQDDIRGGEYQYGEPTENNDTPATATDLGNLVSGTPIARGAVPMPISGVNDPAASILAVSATGQSDYYKFTISAALALTVTATPTGTTYDDSPQDGSTGNCPNPGTNSTNALAVANLQLEVRDTNGTTILGTSNTAAAGVAEVISSLTLPAAGTYFVRVSCSSIPGGESQLYRLTVSGSSGTVCPSFTTNPQAAQVCEGSQAQFTIAASGLPVPTLQWRKNTIPLINSAHIVGADTATLTINNVAAADLGSYDCVATNSCGPATSTAAALTMVGAINITTQPQSQTVALGAPVTLSVIAATATGYQWYQDNQILFGANSSTYQIASMSSGDEGSYHCLVSNACFVVSSAHATLTIGTVCYPNCDGSTQAPILNVLDFSCFLNRFAAADPYANCDNSTQPPVLNVLDFSCFLNQFAAGCP